MPDPAWPSSPPEANYLRLVGPGAAGTATTLASGAAWQALMGSSEAAFAVSSLNTAVTALDFEGVGGLNSATAATGLNSALQMLAGWVQEKPPIATSAVAAYETAASSMIPAEVSIANRTEQAADVAMNPLVLGALTPVIVALDTEYFGEHWPHNAAAGAAYGGTLAALVSALAVPPPLSPPGGSPAAPAVAAEAIAQSASQAAAGEAMQQTAGATTGDSAAAPAQTAGQMASMMSQPMQSAMGALQPLTGMFQAPLQAFQAMASLPQSMMGSLAGGFGGPGALDVAPATALIAAPGVAAGGGAVGAGGGAAAGSGAGAVGAGVGGGVGGASVPGGGLTSFTRPASSFGAENGGRPVGLKTGLLSAAEARPRTTAGGAMPFSPAHAGMLQQGKSENARETSTQARVVLAEALGRKAEPANAES